MLSTLIRRVEDLSMAILDRNERKMAIAHEVAEREALEYAINLVVEDLKKSGEHSEKVGNIVTAYRVTMEGRRI